MINWHAADNELKLMDIMYETQGDLILGANSGCDFCSLWHFIKKCDKYYYKMWQLVYYNMRQKFIEKCVSFFIAKYSSFYKMG